VVSLRIALAQVPARVGDVRANSTTILAAWETAAAADAQVVVLPELALIGYPPDDLLLRPELIAHGSPRRDPPRSRRWSARSAARSGPDPMTGG